MQEHLGYSNPQIQVYKSEYMAMDLSRDELIDMRDALLDEHGDENGKINLATEAGQRVVAINQTLMTTDRVHKSE